VTEAFADLLLVAATVVGWFVLEVRQARRRRPDAVREDGRSLLVLRVTTVAGFVLAVVVARLVPDAAVPPRLAYAASLVLLWCGIALRWWSFRALGEYFTFAVETSDDQPVVSTGPYRWVRHPAYLGMLLALAGIGTLLANAVALLVLLTAVMVGVVYRIDIEERALVARLGDRYVDYAEARRRLVPGLW
jgi:protein-S-isoprenylcysteine O-methyltransferase Ste14